MPYAPESHALVSNKCVLRKQHLTGPDHLRCSNEIRDILEIVADARAPTRPLACKVAELFQACCCCTLKLSNFELQ